VVVGDGKIPTRGLRFLSRTRLHQVLEKHLNPRVEIFPTPTNTRD